MQRENFFFIFSPSQKATQIKVFFPFYDVVSNFFSFPYHFDILVLMCICFLNALAMLKSVIFQHPVLLE